MFLLNTLRMEGKQLRITRQETRPQARRLPFVIGSPAAQGNKFF